MYSVCIYIFFFAHLTVVYSSVYYRSACATPSGSPCSSHQSVYSPAINDPRAGIIAPKMQSSWNPFEDDNFSKLTVEELLHKDFAKLTDSKLRFSVLVYRIENFLHEPKYLVFFLDTAAKPGERTVASGENLIPGLDAFPGTHIIHIML